jgi:tetratricopeptide (TPR) repeat protein
VKVWYNSAESRKEAKDSPLKGKIKSESPGGIVITVGKEDRTIPALDVIQVAYASAKVAELDFRGPDGNIQRALATDPKTKAKERKEFFAKALTGFTELAGQVADHGMARRYIAYRIAEINYRMSLDDSSLRTKAVAGLEEFAAANPGGWEIVPALRTLAHIHEEANDQAKALSALSRLADLKEAPKEIQRESQVAVSQMLIRFKKFPEAEARLKQLLDALPPGDPQKARTQVYLVQCQVAQGKKDGAEKLLKDAIAATDDALLRGIAYNGLGDLYRAQNQPEEAFWAYLRVDTMYNADANEHGKAIYNLSELFKEKKFGDRTGDPVRAKNYRERLADKRFADTEWKKYAPQEP